MGISHKLLCRPGVSKLINLIPNHYTRITRFNAHHRFSVDHVITWNQTWKRRPLPIRSGRQRDWVTLPSPQSCMPHDIDGMAGEQQMWSSIRLFLLKVVEEAATLCIPGVGHHPIAHMPAMGKLQGVAMV